MGFKPPQAFASLHINSIEKAIGAADVDATIGNGRGGLVLTGEHVGAVAYAVDPGAVDDAMAPLDVAGSG